MAKVKIPFEDIVKEALKDKNAVCNFCGKERIVTLDNGKYYCKNCEKEVQQEDITYLIR